jgi:hypothetical protein
LNASDETTGLIAAFHLSFQRPLAFGQGAYGWGLKPKAIFPRRPSHHLRKGGGGKESMREAQRSFE